MAVTCGMRHRVRSFTDLSDLYEPLDRRHRRPNQAATEGNEVEERNVRYPLVDWSRIGPRGVALEEQERQERERQHIENDQNEEEMVQEETFIEREQPYQTEEYHNEEENSANPVDYDQNFPMPASREYIPMPYGREYFPIAGDANL